MGRGKSLSEFEIGQILAYQSEGKSGRWIANRMNRSKSAINEFLKNPEQYGQAQRSGRPRTLSDRDRRHVLRLLTDENRSCSSAKNELGLDCHRSTIYRAARETEHVDFKKANHKPPLSKEHRAARVDFAKKYIDFGDNWSPIMFSDEKKFNLDGPDGFHYFWSDLRKEEKIFSKRQFGGGSVMVWAGISFNGTTDIAFLTPKMNSEDYQKVLESHLIPVFHEFCGTNGTFQQDNAPIHNSFSTRTWLSSQNIQIMNWPSRSPDLSPIENVWGTLSRKVYQNGRQFSSKSELEKAISYEWTTIDQNYIQDLILSMKERLISVIEKKGAETSYWFLIFF